MATVSKSETPKNYVVEQLKTLEGSTLDIVTSIKSFGLEYPTLFFTLPNGRSASVVLQSDAEGNGPGWAEVQL